MFWLKNKLIAKTMIWLAAEILLNCLGIDDLADYSEFVFEKNSEKNVVLLHGKNKQLNSHLQTQSKYITAWNQTSVIQQNSLEASIASKKGGRN